MSALKRTLLSVVGNRVLSKARVAEVNQVSEHFRFIDLESEAFRNTTWRPGEKVQLNAGGWNLRTYTPLSLNRELGRLGILAYAHGVGPGSHWATRARPGDPLQFFGPHSSLNLAKTEGPFVLFGDETAIAMATTLRRHLGFGVQARFVFEARSSREMHTIVSGLGLKGVEIFQTSATGALPGEVGQAVLAAAKDLGTCNVVLAGRAQSIRQLRGELKNGGVSMSRVRTKAYWSLGKEGLD